MESPRPVSELGKGEGKQRAAHWAKDINKCLCGEKASFRSIDIETIVLMNKCAVH